MVPNRSLRPPRSNAARRRSAIGLALLIAAALGGRTPAQGDGPQAPGTGAGTTAPESPWFRGRLASRYWLRSGSSRSDQDVFETLTLDLGDPRRHDVTAYFVGRLAADIDGIGSDPSQFASIDDRFGNVYGRVYDAYLDFHRLPGLELARAGRQVIHETPEFAYFDGLRLETDSLGEAGIQFGGYAGASTHLYEASSQGDWTAGLYSQARPWDGGRVRIDWMHLEDEALLGSHDDDLFSAGVWQRVGERWDFDVQYSRIEERDRDVRARATFDDQDSETTAQLSFYQLLNTQKDLVVELDPFFSALHDEFPYWRTGAMVSKRISEGMELQGGADIRRVTDRGDISEFNRDFERVYLTWTSRDLLCDGLSIAVTGDSWHSDSQRVLTWGLDLQKDVADGWTASIGSYYSLYKFDLFLDTERDNVRSWFAKLAHKASATLKFDASYELEDSDIGQDHVLRMGALWRF